jgi:OmpA-OmpF porin, OOP family
MRKRAIHWQILGFALALTVVLGSSAAGAATCEPKVQNFILFVDQSGSMYATYEKAKAVKMAVAKQILADMNALIPELAYKGGLDLFAPFQELQAPVVYNRADLAAAIKAIKDQQAIYGRQTPMESGILSAEEAAVLAGLKGKTAVIMLSDGKSNVGGDPVQAAKDAAAQHPNVVFHVVSFSQVGVKDTKTIKGTGIDQEKERKGEAINRAIAQIGGGMYVEASSLYKNRAAMQQFVNDVFCAVPKPAAAVEQKIVLRGINFDVDKANIKPEYQPILDEAASTLKSKPDVKVVITGHTDNTGTADYNMGLSERRAKSVMQYFASKGISASRMQAVGRGMNDPVADNKTKDGRALNRRVELKVVQ